MGMAASQARFLGLTARKNNVEYEGQQINQQRTALGNQTANYYNQMLGMKVPVPPAIDDYTKTVYTFADGSLKNTVTSLIAGQDGLYTVSYLRQWTDDFAVVAATPSIVNKTDAVTPAVLDQARQDSLTTGAQAEALRRITGLNPAPTTVADVTDALTAMQQAHIDAGRTTEAAALAALNTAIGAAVPAPADANEAIVIAQQIAAQTKAAAANALNGAFMIGSQELRPMGQTPTEAQIKNDPYLSTLSSNGEMNEKIEALLKTELEQIKQLDDSYGPSNLGWMVRYVQNSTTGAYEPQFQNLDVLVSPNTIYDAQTGQSQSSIPAYKVGSQQKNEEIKGVQARLEQDATGRLINITLNPGQGDAVTYALTTNTVADQARYDDAINQYEYDKYQYDQQIQEVNAKIQIIQIQDKNLELRLKQLDTEQNAIQTEMDAVSKVIQKNVESTFKTFG